MGAKKIEIFLVELQQMAEAAAKTTLSVRMLQLEA